MVVRFFKQNSYKLITRFLIFIYPILPLTLVCNVSLVESRRTLRDVRRADSTRP